MKGILNVTGIGVEKEELEEIRNAVRKINKKRQAENRERLDFIIIGGEKNVISRGLACR